MINLVVSTTTQSLQLANWASYPQAERISDTRLSQFLSTTKSKRFLLNGFGWVKYWRIAFNSTNSPKFSPARILRYTVINLLNIIILYNIMITSHLSRNLTVPMTTYRCPSIFYARHAITNLQLSFIHCVIPSIPNYCAYICIHP